MSVTTRSVMAVNDHHVTCKFVKGTKRRRFDARLLDITQRITIVMLVSYLVNYSCITSSSATVSARECHLRPVIHVLKQRGCVPKPVPSFACQGACHSYVQVSGSKFWQVERSCMCCQETGVRETTDVVMFCPADRPRFRKVTTRAPVDCMCRPCTSLDETGAQVQPQELLNLIEEST